MARRNGGIIGPANTPVGGLAGVAKGVWRINDVLNYVKRIINGQLQRLL